MKRVLDMRPGRARGTSAKGAVVIELATILPFLALMLLVVADLGLVLNDHQILQNAAREGARFSSLPENSAEGAPIPAATLDRIRQYVADYCDNAGLTIDAGDVAVDQDALIDVSGRTMKASRVTVTVDREFLFPAAGLLGGPTVRLVGEAVFRNLY